MYGLFRSGKSTLINHFLKINGWSDGFKVSSSSNGCTKGFYAWSMPFDGLDENGKEIHVLLVDTEGILDPKRKLNTK